MTTRNRAPELRTDQDFLAPSGGAITCPNCRGEARFAPAVVQRPLRSAIEQGFKPAKNERIFCFHPRDSRGFDRHRQHTYQYRGFGTRNEDGLYAITGNGVSGEVNLGTAMCDQCHVPTKVTLRWPEDAYYQISYMGRRLWFDDRNQAVGFLELLTNPQASVPKYRYWYDRVVPTTFKTVRARKRLAPRIRKMLRA